MAESSSVQSLERAFDLLEKLCRSRNGMTIGTLSAETGLHKSTVHRLLATMCTVAMCSGTRKPAFIARACACAS